MAEEQTTTSTNARLLPLRSIGEWRTIGTHRWVCSHDTAGVKRKVAGRLVSVKPGSEGGGHFGSSDPGVSLIVFRQNVSDDVQT